MELGFRLREHSYKVFLEDRSIISNSPIDILASKEGRTFIFELATSDMNLELKHSGFVANAYDKAESTLFHKIDKQISRYKDRTSAPIIIVFNLTRTPDTDIHGILYYLREVQLTI